MFRVSAFILLLSFLQCHADDVPMQVPIQKDFKMSQFKGQWYELAASSNCPMFQKMKEDTTLPIIVYSVGQDNVVKSSVAYNTPNGCQQMDVTYETVTEGQYKDSSVCGENGVYIASTDYTGSALEVTITNREGMSCTTIKLFGRDKNLTEEIKLEFLEFVKSMGMKPENAKVFIGGELCIPHVA